MRTRGWEVSSLSFYMPAMCNQSFPRRGRLQSFSFAGQDQFVDIRDAEVEHEGFCNRGSYFKMGIAVVGKCVQRVTCLRAVMGQGTTSLSHQAKLQAVGRARVKEIQRAKRSHAVPSQAKPGKVQTPDFTYAGLPVRIQGHLAMCEWLAVCC